MQPIKILKFLLFALIGFLVFRLTQLQILDYDKYKVLAQNNTTRTALTQAPRGIIYDRHGEILATSKQSLSLIVFPASLKSEEQRLRLAERLSEFITTDYEELKQVLLEIDSTTPLPITVENDINIQTAIKIYENKNLLDGVAIAEQAVRYYPYHDLAPHLLGFVGQINSQELKKGRARGLGLGDIIGKDGLEKAFDDQLQGAKGESRVAVDRFGKSLESFGDQKRIIKKAIKGEDLHLTIDIKLQQVAQEALGDKQGAAVVVDPRTGEVLVLASSPGFDPNIFTKAVSQKTYNDLLHRKAFINRTISAYTPGSVWKPVTALAALEHAVINSDDYFKVSGSYYLGNFRFGDWTGEAAVMNLTEALVWSRNTFFYQIAKKMKADWISDLGKDLGAGTRTGVELLGEAQGVVPSPRWKKQNYHEPWFPGNTLHLSIGQSFLMLTPLQVAKIYSVIANNGFVPHLHLIKNRDKEKLDRAVTLSGDNLQVVKQALEACVERGTGQASKLEAVQIAGKTGSAEVQGYAHSTHGWFASYAPADKPEVVVVVFMEGGGHGGTVAAPVAKKIYQAYFEGVSLDVSSI